ncbi:MAG: pantetheine-phosphate adenylyltransferase [Ferrovum sp.]|nr:pantetheine-phosphate adenylyltransferase [Ferrovum sp.]NDU87889.1 pantetheine-phosphate adenylyltransferase [Ferrovum sp.]
MTEVKRIKAVYAGTFDPLTLGHEDLIRRASGLFDRVVVAVADSRIKQPLFTLEERVDMARESLARFTNVTVQGFDGLLAHFVRDHGAKVMIRGLRAVSDFDFEFQMAGMNRRLQPDVETLFLTPAEQYAFISSTMIREIASLGGEVGEFVNVGVHRRLMEKMNFDRPGGY